MAVCYFVGSRTAIKHFVSLNPDKTVSTHNLRWVAGTWVNQGMTQVRGFTLWVIVTRVA